MGEERTGLSLDYEWRDNEYYCKRKKERKGEREREGGGRKKRTRKMEKEIMEGKDVRKLTIVEVVLGQSEPLSHGIVIIALTSGDADRCHL